MFSTFIVHKGTSGWTHSVVKPNLDHLSGDDTITNTHVAVVIQIGDEDLLNAKKATSQDITFFGKGLYAIDDELGYDDDDVDLGHRLFIMKTLSGEWLYRFMRRRGDHWRMCIPDILKNYVVDIQEDPDTDADCGMKNLPFATSIFVDEPAPKERLSGEKRPREVQGHEPSPKRAKAASLEYSFNAMNDFVTQSDIRSIMESQNKKYLPSSSSSSSSAPPALIHRPHERLHKNLKQKPSVATELVDLDKLRREVIEDVNREARNFISSDSPYGSDVEAVVYLKRKYLEDSSRDIAALEERTTKEVQSLKAQMAIFTRYLEKTDTMTDQKRKECHSRVQELIRDSEALMKTFQKALGNSQNALKWRLACLDECVSVSSYFASGSY